MIFNYIRVSTIEQNTERQLRDVVCDRVYEEKISGKNTNRPQLQAMLSNIIKNIFCLFFIKIITQFCFQA